MKENPLINCTFCRTPFERCWPRKKGDGVALPLARSLHGGKTSTAPASSRPE